MKRRTRALALALALGLVASACGDDGGEANGGSTDSGTTSGESGSGSIDSGMDPQSGGILTFGVYGEAPGLDPVVANGSGTTGGHEMSAIYDTVMRWNPEAGKYEERTAESLTPNDDSSVWTLKIKPGITFTDGTDYDAEAVKLSVERHATFKSRAAGLVAKIAEMKVVDPLTVEFTLTAPWGGFPYLLSYTPGMVASPTALAACGDTSPRECDFNLNPVGAGPFMIDAFLPKESITMSKNPDYYAGEAYLDGLKFVFLDTGREKTYDALTNDTIDAGFLRNPNIIQKAQADGVDGALALNWMGGVILMNNGAKVSCKGGEPAPICTGVADGESASTTPVTADKRVRQAVALAIDPEVINNRLWEGAGFSGTEIFQEESRFYTGTPGIEFDVAEAKKLVEEVKAEGEWDGSIKVSCHSFNPTFVIAVSAMLEGAGFTVEGNSDQDVAGLINEIQIKKDFEVACWGFNVYEDDPFVNLNQNLNSTSSGNWMGYSNPAVDAFLDEAFSAADDEARMAAYDGIAKLWNEDVPSVVFEATGEMVAWDDDVHGIEMTVTNSALFDKAWIG